MASKLNSETATQKILKISVTLLTCFVIIQLFVGFLTRSQTIIADGISGSTGVITTFISLIIVKFIARKNAEKYPYGKETLESFIGIVNYVLMLIIVVIIIADNVQVILAGGNDEVHVISVILFGILSTIFNIGVFKYLKELGKDSLTPIVEAELVGWQFSVIISIGVVVGFSLSWIMDLTPFSVYTSYVDPVLAVFLMLCFATTPLFEIKNCLKELMQATPSDEIIVIVTKKIEEIDQDYDFINKVLRLGKSGGEIRIEVDYVIKKESVLDSIDEQDQLRSQLTNKFLELPYGKWVNINFTSDPKWTKHTLV